MAKRRRSLAIVQDEDTSDLGFFAERSEGEKPVQRNAANARERARMRVLSKAFGRLKTSLPWVPKDTKLSKLDTLRLAATYIAHLRKILREDCGDEGAHVMSSNVRDCTTHPITLTWPFTINSRPTYGDYASMPPNQENSRGTVEYTQDDISDYRNLVPCEYIPMNPSNSYRKDKGHYLQQ